MEEEILSTGPLPTWAAERLSGCGRLLVLHDPPADLILARLGKQTRAVVARSSGPITAEMIQAAPRLKVIARTGVGFDNVDVAAATARRIPVLYTPGALSVPVAEHTSAFLLTAVKNLNAWHRTVLQGHWQDRDRRLNGDLFGLVLGIVGFGRIGKEVWRLLQPFGIRFLVHDPYIDSTPFTGEESLEFVDLENLLKRSQAVTLHVPLTAETRGLINAHTIELFRPGAILINTARGAVIESHRLLKEALDRDLLSYVLLDTPVLEPADPADPLLAHPRVLCTPHNASRTALGQQRVIETMVRDLTGFLKGTPPPAENIVNAEALAG